MIVELLFVDFAVLALLWADNVLFFCKGYVGVTTVLAVAVPAPASSSVGGVPRPAICGDDVMKTVNDMILTIIALTNGI